MALLNPTLRDPGATPGSAAHWVIGSLCAAQRLAAFGPPPLRAVEDFERWTTLATSFREGTLVLAFFDLVPRGYEAFDGWAGSAFLDALPEVVLDACPFGGLGADDFEGWLAAPWASTWADVGNDPALFAGLSVDNFEAWSVAAVPVWSSALFDGGAAETFAGAWTAMTTL